MHLGAEFEPRTDEDQRRRMAGYTYLKTFSAREKYMTEHATRWSELARLPYFDMVRMIVIDPMHNLLLGQLVTIVLLQRANYTIKAL